MDIEGQARLVDDLASLSKEDIIQVAYDAQNSMLKAYDEMNIEEFGEVETEPLKDLRVDLTRIEPSTSKKVTFAGKQPKPLKVLKGQVGEQEPTFSGFGENPPTNDDTPDEIEVRYYFTKGRRLRQKNAIYSHLLTWGVVRDGQVRDFRNPDRWLAADLSKVINRLMSNTHGQIKRKAPLGYSTILNYIDARPDWNIFPLLGDNIRRRYAKANPGMIPKKKIIKDKPSDHPK